MSILIANLCARVLMEGFSDEVDQCRGVRCEVCPFELKDDNNDDVDCTCRSNEESKRIAKEYLEGLK